MIVLFAEILGYLLAALGCKGRSLLARTFAILAFDILRVRRALVLKNIGRLYGPQASPLECARVGRTSLANFILTTLEFFAAQRIFPRHHVDFVRPEIMREALSRGKGVYLLGIHMGNFELLGTAIGRNFARMNAPTKVVGKGKLAQWVKARREQNGIVELQKEKGKSGTRTSRIIEALRRNEAIGFMVDQRRSKGVLLPFFGEAAWTNVGIIFLWKLQEAPIVPVSIRRCGDNRSEVIFYDEFLIECNSAWSNEQFVAENGLRMNTIVEKMIAENPEEYFWMHDRWKK